MQYLYPCYVVLLTNKNTGKKRADCTLSDFSFSASSAYANLADTESACSARQQSSVDILVWKANF